MMSRLKSFDAKASISDSFFSSEVTVCSEAPSFLKSSMIFDCSIISLSIILVL